MGLLKFRVGWISVSQLIAYLKASQLVHEERHVIRMSSFDECLNMKRITLFTTRELHDVSQKTMNQLQHL